MPLDIALPFYGDVGYLKETVESVIAQSDPDWRLLVVDDGYPDSELPGWFKSLNDPRIVYSRNEVNLGANGNYRRCIEFIQEDYCVIMGADDLLEPNFVATVQSLIKKYPKASIFHPGVIVIDELGLRVTTRSDEAKNRIRPNRKSPEILIGESLASSLMRGNWMYFPSMVWNSSAIKATGFRKGLNVCQDLALAIDLIKQGNSMVVFDDRVFRYRRHSESDSSVKALSGERFEEEKKFFNELSAEFKSIGWRSASRSAKLHLSSRLHALSLLPASVKSRQGTLALLKHGLF